MKPAERIQKQGCGCAADAITGEYFRRCFQHTPQKRPRGRVIPFPVVPARLALEGFTLIAWRIGAEGRVSGDPDWFHAIWKPEDGKGWYEIGYSVPADKAFHGHLMHSRSSRAQALTEWHMHLREPFDWHYLMSAAEAFPEKRRVVARSGQRVI